MASEEENKRFDKGLVKFMIAIGLAFMIIMFIAGAMTGEVYCYFMGFFLGGGSAAFGIGGLLASKESDVVQEKAE